MDCLSDQALNMNTLSHQHQLNAHEGAPQELREYFKSFKGQLGDKRLSEALDIGSLTLPGLNSIPQDRVLRAFSAFLTARPRGHTLSDILADEDEMNHVILLGKILDGEPDVSFEDLKVHSSAFAVQKIPGLFIVPSLLPPGIQKSLLSSLLHHGLSDPQHSTNLHLHYDITYPESRGSLFSYDPDIVILDPKDTSVHSCITMRQALEKKLRWVTLGGQYDWTTKEYPADAPPRFPKDIANLIGGLFPDMEPQAAIVNVYSPGDTLSMHRDVSEEADRGLVSISLGCDCIFVVGREDKTTGDIQKVAIRLKSGDALYMTGESRLAWHGVPKIIPDTCPEYLSDWPGDKYPEWKGWMDSKRINLNVRQMRKSTKVNISSEYKPIGFSSLPTIFTSSHS